MAEQFHPSIKGILVKTVLAAVGISLGILLFGSFLGNNILLALAIVWAIAALTGLFAYATHRFKIVEIGENTIKVKTGVFTLRSVVIPYEKITHLRASQSLFQRILNVGNLDIDTAGTPEPEVVVPDIPYRHLETILKNIEQRSHCKVDHA